MEGLGWRNKNRECHSAQRSKSSNLLFAIIQRNGGATAIAISGYFADSLVYPALNVPFAFAIGSSVG